MKRNDREEKTRGAGEGGGSGGEGTPGNSWWGCAARFSKVLTLFQTKKCHFSHPFSDLASKKLCHHYLVIFLNPFRISIFLTLSYSFGIETMFKFIHSSSSPANHARFQTIYL